MDEKLNETKLLITRQDDKMKWRWNEDPEDVREASFWITKWR